MIDEPPSSPRSWVRTYAPFVAGLVVLAIGIAISIWTYRSYVEDRAQREHRLRENLDEVHRILEDEKPKTPRKILPK